MTTSNDTTVAPDGADLPAVDAAAGGEESTPDGGAPHSKEVAELIKRRDSALARARAAEAKAADMEKREKARNAANMSLEDQMAELRAENEQLKAVEVQRLHRQRQDAFTAAVAEYAELSPGRVRAYLLAAREDIGLEIAPEEFSKTEVRAAVAAIKRVSPEAFEPKSGGSPIPAPGSAAKPASATSNSQLERILAHARSGGSFAKK